MVISVSDLVFRYPGHLALDHVSFDLPEGSIAALVGPNGAGKTTLMRCLAGLTRPWEGSVRLGGVDVVADPRAAHRHLGFLQDFFGVWSDMTVRQCLRHFARAQRVDDSQIERRVTETIGILGLSTRADHLSSHLSRGQRQRLAIGQAMVHMPKVLILDEPASGLDPEARIDLSKVFLRLRDEGMTLLVSSHILAELDEYADRLLVLQQGKLLQSGPLRDSVVATEVREIEAVLSEPAEPWQDRLASLTGVVSVRSEETTLSFAIRGGDPDQRRILAELVAAGVPVVEYRRRLESFQDKYLEMVRGRA